MQKLSLKLHLIGHDAQRLFNCPYSGFKSLNVFIGADILPQSGIYLRHDYNRQSDINIRLLVSVEFFKSNIKIINLILCIEMLHIVHFDYLQRKQRTSFCSGVAEEDAATTFLYYSNKREFIASDESLVCNSQLGNDPPVEGLHLIIHYQMEHHHQYLGLPLHQRVNIINSSYWQCSNSILGSYHGFSGLYQIEKLFNLTVALLS